MYVRLLELEEFRAYHRLDLQLDQRGLRLIGRNASGKSSLLEAIAMLATTRSPRSAAEREVINWSSGTDYGVPPFARVRGRVERADGTVDIEMALQADSAGTAPMRKQIKLGGRPVRAMDAVGRLKAVLFSPEDVTLVSGSPAGRRRYLDLTICQLDGAYLRALSRYGRVLDQRNSLLKTLGRERAGVPAAAAQLAFWDGELVVYGSAIVARRWATIVRFSELTREHYLSLSRGANLDMAYLPTVPMDALAGKDVTLSLEAAQAVVAREYEERLRSARPDELRRGVTLIGPHRDDLSFVVDGIDLGTYGSRGQQRLAVVALKLAETDLMTELAGEPPVLLLDDVLSELDAEHRSQLTGTAAAVHAQLIVTATDRNLLERPDLAELPWARVEAGTITLGG